MPWRYPHESPIICRISWQMPRREPETWKHWSFSRRRGPAASPSGGYEFTESIYAVSRTCHRAAAASRPFTLRQGTAGPALPQHVVAHVPLVRRDDREMIFAARGEEIHRTADVGGNLRPADRIEHHHQLDRNTCSAELRGHVDSGAAAQRVTDDHDRAQPAALVLLDRLLRQRRPVAIILDRRGNAVLCHPAAEFAEPRRIIAQTEQHIEVRASL